MTPGAATTGLAARWQRKLRFLLDQFQPLPSPDAAERALIATYSRESALLDYENHAAFGLYESEREIVDAGHLSRGESLLDIGCGAGREAIGFAARGLRVTAVDPSPAMIERARRMRGALEIDFAVMSLTSLTFESASFDAAYVSSDVYQRTPGRRTRIETLERLGEIVRPGGTVIFAASVSQGESTRMRLFVETPRDVARRYWPRHVAEHGDVFTRDTMMDATLYRHAFHSSREIFDEIIDAGLSPVALVGDFYVARAPGGSITYEAPDSVSASPVANGLLVADVGAGATFRLNAAGAAIWTRIVAGERFDDVVTALAGTFAIARDRLAGDARALVTDLVKLRLLRARGARL